MRFFRFLPAHLSSKVLSSLPVRQTTIYVLLFNTVIALIASAVFRGDFVDSLIMSQCFGLAIFASVVTFDRFREIRISNAWIPIMTGTGLGYLLGVTGIYLRHGEALGKLLQNTILHIDELAINLLVGSLFGTIIFYFFVTRSRVRDVNDELQKERIRSLDYARRMTETRLRLLQAQIEPHFLFNTLSGISGLIESKPEQGRQLLESLTRYLRTTLDRSRQSGSSLRHEIQLIRDYLDIFRIRMGERLSYRIDIPETLMDLPFPPMLLQPLVENAIRHGLEPAEHGGSVTIIGTDMDDCYRISVRDTGLGFTKETLSGFGLTNIRERLQALYGERARLEIRANHPAGVMATIEVPRATR